MSIKSLIDDTIELIEVNAEYTVNLSDLQEELDKQLKEHEITGKKAQEQYEALEQRYKEELKNKANLILNVIDSDTERDKVEETELSLNDVAELQLLSTMDYSAEDLRKYMMRLAGNGIAYKKLNEMAMAKDIFVEQPKRLNDLIDETTERLHKLVPDFQYMDPNNATIRPVYKEGDTEKRYYKTEKYLIDNEVTAQSLENTKEELNGFDETGLKYKYDSVIIEDFN